MCGRGAGLLGLRVREPVQADVEGQRLAPALRTVTSMKSPSIAEILRRRGFGYEADQMDELILA